MITVPNKNKINTFFSEISKMAIIIQIWHRATFCFMCISGLGYMIMVPNMMKIYLAIMEECARTERDRRMDRTCSYIPGFRYCGARNSKGLIWWTHLFEWHSFTFQNTHGHGVWYYQSSSILIGREHLECHRLMYQQPMTHSNKHHHIGECFWKALSSQWGASATYVD